MTRLDWYFDFVSPFAYLQWRDVTRRQPPASLQLRPVPVLLAGLLAHWGSLGPAEVPPKRRFTYRQVLWLARQMDQPLTMPAAHPFNPLKALRLALALDCRAEVVDALFTYLWCEGRSLDDEPGWQRLLGSLGLAADARPDQDDAVKAQLRDNTGAACDLGVFGVPTCIYDGEIYWGLDSTPMLQQAIADPQSLRDPEMLRVGDLPEGVQRRVADQATRSRKR